MFYILNLILTEPKELIISYDQFFFIQNYMHFIICSLQVFLLFTKQIFYDILSEKGDKT